MKDPNLTPFLRLKKSKDFEENYRSYFISMVKALISQSNNVSALDSIVYKELSALTNIDERISIEDWENATCTFNYFVTLDEKGSRKHLTPYHLSYFLQFFANQKVKGQYFTPSFISKYLVEQAINYYTNGENINISALTFFDPACGTGNILLKVIEHYISQLNHSEFPPSVKAQLLKTFIEQGIFGVDIDPLALFIAKIRIWLLIDHYFPLTTFPLLARNFRHGNILIDTLSVDFGQLGELNTYKPLLINERFDIILTNPPFMVYGLRRGQKYPETFKEYLRKRFYVAEYKLPLYPIFIERSLELLKEGGILGIITPDSYLLGRYYAKLRELLLRKTNIKEITQLTFEPFLHATIGRTLLSFFEKRPEQNQKGEVSRKEAITIVKKIPHYQAMHEVEGYPNIIRNIGRYKRFVLFFSKNDEKIIKNWNEIATTKLGDLCTIHTGIRSKIGQKKIISRIKRGPNWFKGLISGKEVLPFRINWAGYYINVEKELLWSGGFNPEIVRQNKILLRQTGDKIICAVDNQGYYHLNNIHALTLKTDEIDLHSLAVILNSSDFNRVYQILSNENDRVFAQIDMDFLQEIPIPLPRNEKEHEKLKEIYVVQKGRNTPYSLSSIFLNET